MNAHIPVHRDTHAHTQTHAHENYREAVMHSISYISARLHRTLLYEKRLCCTCMWDFNFAIIITSLLRMLDCTFNYMFHKPEGGDTCDAYIFSTVRATADARLILFCAQQFLADRVRLLFEPPQPCAAGMAPAWKNQFKPRCIS